VWALTLIYDGHQQVSGVGVLDGERPEDGPVGVAWFDHAVPETYHGAWVG
jgi:all-trans-8'-apo-beta-carotenal 15,15'-oxygenase